MPFPLFAVAGTLGAAGLGYLLFKPDAPAQGGGSAPALPPTKPLATPDNPLPGNLRPSNTVIPDLIKPQPAPIPPPTVIPGNLPAPNLPIPIPPGGVLPNVSPTPPFVPPIQPTPILPTEQTATVTAPSGVNLRSAPSTSGTVLMGMTFGTRVKINSLNPTPTANAPKGWYNVTHPSGKTGFATAEFITPDGGNNPPSPLPANILPNVLPTPSLPNPIPSLPLPPIPIPGTIQAKVLGSPGTNLRAAPNTSGTLIKGIFNGTIVTVLSTTKAPPTPGAPQGWVNVRDPSGSTGWMSREFLEPIGGASFGHDPSKTRFSQYGKMRASVIRP